MKPEYTCTLHINAVQKLRSYSA